LMQVDELQASISRPLPLSHREARVFPVERSISGFGVAANDLLTRMDEILKATVRIIEIAELVGVSDQQANKIVDAPGFPGPVEREGQSRLWDRRRSRLGQRSGGVGSLGANGSGRPPQTIRCYPRRSPADPGTSRRPRAPSTTAWLLLAHGTAAVYRWRYGHRR
jgi:hypothetical protein